MALHAGRRKPPSPSVKGPMSGHPPVCPETLVADEKPDHDCRTGRRTPIWWILGPGPLCILLSIWATARSLPRLGAGRSWCTGQEILELNAPVSSCQIDGDRELGILAEGTTRDQSGSFSALTRRAISARNSTSSSHPDFANGTRPPSTARSCPVMNDAASLARNTAAQSRSTPCRAPISASAVRMPYASPTL